MAGITIEEGRVGKRSRLYRHLTEPRRRKAMHLGNSPELSLKRLNGSHPVFLLKEADGGRQYILKSFTEHGVSTSRLLRIMNKEYDRLKYLERIRPGGGRSRCARPVCRDRAGLFFIEEAVRGRSLGKYAAEWLRRGHGPPEAQLDLLAGFLYDLHSCTATGTAVRPGVVRKELQKHVVQARDHGSLGNAELGEARKLVDRWCRSTGIRTAKLSLVHGDATVSNFMFRGGRMFAIDLERSRCADPAYDLGTMAGELFNEALAHTGNPYKADPCIHLLYRSYAERSRDPGAEFASLTARNPLYMANSLLRMSRNRYFTPDHRRKLAFYAMECLRSPVPE